MSDAQLRAVLTEIQARAQTSQRDLALVSSQLSSLSRSTRLISLTVDELKPVTTPMYSGVGRMFIRTSKDEVLGNLEREKKGKDEEMKALEKKREYLQKTWDNTQLHINAAMNRT